MITVCFYYPYKHWVTTLPKNINPYRRLRADTKQVILVSGGIHCYLGHYNAFKLGPSKILTNINTIISLQVILR